jgi:hypothetical protein
MDNKIMLLIYVSAAQLLLQMMAVIITSTKRKRVVSGEPISYGPTDERDRIRIEYLNKKSHQMMNTVICLPMFKITPRDPYVSVEVA